jgi:hypothetical protein
MVGVSGDFHKRRGEASRWLRIGYKVSAKSSPASGLVYF